MDPGAPLPPPPGADMQPQMTQEEYDMMMHQQQMQQQMHPDEYNQMMMQQQNVQPVQYVDGQEQVPYTDQGQQQMYVDQGQPVQYIDQQQPLPYADNAQQGYIDQQPHQPPPAAVLPVPDQAVIKKKSKENSELLHDFEDFREYFQSLKIEGVLKWDPREVSERFLRPMNLAPLSQLFIEHKINGRTLLGLSKDDLRAMKILAIGDRVLISNAIKLLAKIQVRAERDRIVWEGSTPTGGIAYYSSIFEMCSYKCFPCCNSYTRWRLTPTGIRERRDPPQCNLCCQRTVNDYKDIRFLKDVDWRWEYQCMCCQKRREVMMLFDHDQTVGDSDEVIIAHPDVGDELVAEMNSLWAEARLVAD
eukprot:m.291995 g.291995  ORF g.291995 m.291995 type:complete len:360 (+) comp19992_c0_seq3:192-1271(+)